MKPILIVGHGVAGAALSQHFLLQNIDFHVVSNRATPPASWAALGLITPRTGRRFTRPWHSETSLPYAFAYYSHIAADASIPMFTVRPTLRYLTQEHELAGWEKKKQSIPSNECSEFQEIPEAYTSYICSGNGIVVQNTGSLDITTMLEYTRNQYCTIECFTDALFDFQDLVITNTQEVFWQGKQYDKIIFCEGWDVRSNALWTHLPVSFLKGEILIVDIPQMPTTMAIKRHITLVPLPLYIRNLYPQARQPFVVGATHERNFSTPLPTHQGKQELLLELEHLLHVPYTILEHRSGIRPTIKGSHPVVGFHAQHSNIGIFNGFGTKGVTLSPYCAHLFTEHILHETTLPKEIDCQRFTLPSRSDK
jgi:glycine/D-amino acid oxidase-like deaminating enzyme